MKFPYFVLAFSIILTVGVTFLFYQSAKTKDIARFNNGVDQIRASLENRVGLYIALLKAGRGFVESSNDIDRQKFANFAESLELDKNYTGTLGIGFSRVVRPDEIAGLEARLRAEGSADFSVFPVPSGRSEQQVIVYLEPLTEANRRAIGFDMSSEENRRAAIERARDTGLPSTTSRVGLMQDREDEHRKGFLIYLPIYANRELPATVEERRRQILGFVYSPFRADDFLRDVQENAGVTDIAVKIFDGQIAPAQLMAQTSTAGAYNFTQAISGEYKSQNEIEVAGRRWILQYESMPLFARQSSVNWTPLIFLCGVIFSFLLFGMTYWESITRAKLQETAENLFESEAQIQGLLEKEQAARRLAETANVTKDEFISVVSHELRTPLNAIAGWTRILRSDELSKNTKEMALQKIEKNLRLQTSLVEDLLNFSQLVSSQNSLDQSPVDCAAIFDAVIDEIRPQAAAKGVDLVIENRLGGELICGDEEKVRTVFHHLLSNALKFTPAGGRIAATLDHHDGAVEFTVEDNGKGIAPQFLPYIFDRFRQDENSTTRRYGGLGLGLAVSEHIVKLHHGTIEACSEGLGKGATFVVRLPLENA